MTNKETTLTQEALILNAVCNLGKSEDSYKKEALENTQEVIGIANSKARKLLIEVSMSFYSEHSLENWQALKGKVLKERQSYFFDKYGEIMNRPNERAKVLKLGKECTNSQEVKKNCIEIDTPNVSSPRGFVAKCFPKKKNPNTDTNSNNTIFDREAFSKLSKEDQLIEVLAVIEEYRVINNQNKTITMLEVSEEFKKELSIDKQLEEVSNG